MPPKPAATRPGTAATSKPPGTAAAKPSVAGSPKPKGPGAAPVTAKPSAAQKPGAVSPARGAPAPSVVGSKKPAVGGKSVAPTKASIVAATTGGLQPLVQTKHIFIQKTAVSLEAFGLGPSKYTAYEILSSQEDRILFAVDSTEVPPVAKICPCLAPQTFKIKVLNSSGKEVLEIFGSLGKDAKAEVKSDDEYYGLVKLDEGTENVYSGSNSKGDNIFTIKKSDDPKLTHDFTIFSANGKNEIGKGSKSWTPSQKKYPEWYSKIEIFGMSFPKDQNLKTKVLLIGAGILMFFRNFGGR